MTKEPTSLKKYTARCFDASFIGACDLKAPFPFLKTEFLSKSQKHIQKNLEHHLECSLIYHFNMATVGVCAFIYRSLKVGGTACKVPDTYFLFVMLAFHFGHIASSILQTKKSNSDY